MEETPRTSLEELTLRAESLRIVNTCENNHTQDDDHENSGICDECLAVPWENFGASDDPGSFTARDPFIAWKYTIPEGHSWPGNTGCRTCRFLRQLLTDYGCKDTTCIRQMYGGWDGEKPFRMTFVRHDEIEDESSTHSALSEDEQDLSCPENGDGFQTDHSSDEDDVFTIWNDSEDGWHTFSIPSFFTTSLEVRAFHSAMQGYKPTDANLRLIKSWLSQCDGTHGEKCQLQNRHYVRNLKVIDCAKRMIVSAPPNCPYVALSYVWGPPSAQPSLASADLTAILPRTIEDSITVTRELGFAYLWVDRYCINQEDDQEKQEQIAQMADVYAAASVTIIAAAGEDPNYGLPGVQHFSRGLRRYEQVRAVRLFANPPINPNDRYPPFYVYESKWASRAWTFQECYNSPRRLFFTDEQITLICNSAAYQETAGVAPHPPSHPVYTNLRGWINDIGRGSVSAAVLAAVPYPLASVMDTLIVYSQRRMSYDSDALNAIVGTLNAFARQSVQHLWGVPIWLPANDTSTERSVAGTSNNRLEKCVGHHSINKTSGNDNVHSKVKDKRVPQSENSFALLWRNNSPRYRRIGFPSWSPLGWKEGPEWPSNPGIGWFMRQTPAVSGSDSLTLLASCHGIKTLPGREDITSYEFGTADYNVTGAVPQTLTVEACTVDVYLDSWPDGVTSEQYRDCVAMRLNDSLEVLLAATWDKAPWEMGINVSLKGIFLSVANSSTCCSYTPHYAMIILEQHGNSWERVAIALLTHNRINSASGDEPICEFPAGYPPLFRHTATGALYTWELSRWNEPSVERLDVSCLALSPDEPWWKSCTGLETITLT